MSDSGPSFSFGNFVPGFDFLKSLTSGAAAGGQAAAGTMPGLGGMTGLSNWVAPTLSVEEVDKRIQELKAVQFWLDQNVHALRATIQALEVQKMTLSTLQGMNLRMEDLAKSFTAGTAAAASMSQAAMPTTPVGASTPAAPAPEPSRSFGRAEPAVPAAESEPGADAGAKDESAAGGKAPSSGVIDPLQWWGALTQQFEQIAGSAMREAANLKMPAGMQLDGAAGGGAPRRKKAPDSARARAPGASGSEKTSPRSKAGAAGGGKPAAAARTVPKKR